MEGKVKYLNGLNINKHYIVMGNPGSGKTRLAKLMAEKFVGYVTNGDRVVNDGMAGLNNVRMLEAANKSLSKKGAMIYI